MFLFTNRARRRVISSLVDYGIYKGYLATLADSRKVVKIA
jgi:hypothetical protein